MKAKVFIILILITCKKKIRAKAKKGKGFIARAWDLQNGGGRRWDAVGSEEAVFALSSLPHSLTNNGHDRYPSFLSQ